MLKIDFASPSSLSRKAALTTFVALLAAVPLTPPAHAFDLFGRDKDKAETAQDAPSEDTATPDAADAPSDAKTMSRNERAVDTPSQQVAKSQEEGRPALPDSAPGSFADLAEELLPSVVNISSTMKLPQDDLAQVPGMQDMPQFPPGSPFEQFFEEFFGQQYGMPRQDAQPAIPPASLGSGFVVDAKNGYIVTNNHVIQDADEVRVTFQDDTTVKAEIVGHDAKTDLAVLKIAPRNDLKAVEFGDSDHMRVGDWVLAIGNPFGLGGTVTAGIVSAQQRNINAGPYDDFIQTDASINRGNSGGPMFDLSGRVIGINTAIYSPSGGSVGIGFAIPSAQAAPVIDQLIEYGQTRRGWLGVRIQSVTDDIADSLGLEEAQGALVADVTPGGPASRTDIQVGDIILAFDGHEIREMRTLPRVVADTEIGKTAKVELLRGGKRKTVKVEVGQLEEAEETGLLDGTPGTTAPPKPDDAIELGSIGLTLAPLTDAAREEFRIDSAVDGVLIADTDASGDAAAKGLVAGDVIMEVNQSPVTSPEEVETAIETALEKGRGSVLLLVNMNGETRFVPLKLQTETDEPATE